jgi:hypothetical protein
MKCVSYECFATWINWWDAVQAHAVAVWKLENDQVDFNDPDYDPTRKPTRAQMDTDASDVNAASAALQAAQTIKAQACGF